MHMLTKTEFLKDQGKYRKAIKEGAVFIYPTDTIYGIGCDATDTRAVDRIRQIKKRPDTPFSIIAPGKRWILENCTLNNDIDEWLKKLPGPYTFVLTLNKKNIISKSVNPGNDTVGVRIPGNWFGGFVESLGIPIVTTSVNIHGEKFMASIEDLDDSIKKAVDFIIYEGEKKGKPSTIVVFDKDKTEIRERTK